MGQVLHRSLLQGWKPVEVTGLWGQRLVTTVIWQSLGGRRQPVHLYLQSYQSLHLPWVSYPPDPKTAIPSSPSPKLHPLSLPCPHHFSLTTTYCQDSTVSNGSLGTVSTSSPRFRQSRPLHPTSFCPFLKPSPPPNSHQLTVEH